MDYVSKKDFSFYQNEILKELKSRDTKINEQIKQNNSELIEQQQSIEQKIELYNQKLEIFMSTQNDDKQTEIKKEFEKFKKKIEQTILQQSTKISTTQRDLFDACIKYDRAISNQEFIPGLIGKSCRFNTSKNFFEYVDKKLNELIIFKDKNSNDLKSYKDKLGNLLEQFKIQIDKTQSEILNNCSESFIKNDNACQDRIKVIEDRISQMRVENGKYCFDLLKKTDDLIKEWAKIENIKDEIYAKLDNELIKYKEYNDGLKKLVKEQKEEFKIIKVRFTELSDFLKDVRFKKNLKLLLTKGKEKNNDLEEKYNYRNLARMSKKINFNRKQRLSKDEKELFEKVKYEGECDIDINLAKKKNTNRKKKTLTNQFLAKTPIKKNITTVDNKKSFRKNSVNIQKLKITHQNNSPKKINENIENEEIEENESFTSDESEEEEISNEYKENNNMPVNQKKYINYITKDNETLSDESENNENNKNYKNNNKNNTNYKNNYINTERKSFLLNKTNSYEKNNNHSRNSKVNYLYNLKEGYKTATSRFFKSDQKISEETKSKIDIQNQSVSSEKVNLNTDSIIKEKNNNDDFRNLKTEINKKTRENSVINNTQNFPAYNFRSSYYNLDNSNDSKTPDNFTNYKFNKIFTNFDEYQNCQFTRILNLLNKYSLSSKDINGVIQVKLFRNLNKKIYSVNERACKIEKIVNTNFTEIIQILEKLFTDFSNYKRKQQKIMKIVNYDVTNSNKIISMSEEKNNIPPLIKSHKVLFTNNNCFNINTINETKGKLSLRNNSKREKSGDININSIVKVIEPYLIKKFKNA